jgi:hypothetical protein
MKNQDGRSSSFLSKASHLLVSFPVATMQSESSTPDPFPISGAQLTGNFCQTLLFGIYLVSCAFCARTLLLTGNGREERWRRPGEVHWLMAMTALALLVISTFDVAIGLLHNYQAFVKSDHPDAVLLDITNWINITRVRLCPSSSCIRYSTQK